MSEVQGCFQTLFSGDDIKEFETAPTPPQTVHQYGPDKGRGLTVQKKVRGT